MRIVRLAVSAVAAATVLVPLTATGAFAAPPNNDNPPGAVSLTLGQTYNEDTSQATTGSLDAKLNQECGAPYTNASVWFTYTPKSDGAFLLDMSASSYSGGFMVFGNKPTLRTFRGCGPETLAINGVAGKKYIIMAFSDTTQKGGKLSVSLQQGPPPPTLSATLNSTGQAYKTGNAAIGGTVTCTNTEFGSLSGDLTQIWKRLKIVGLYNKNLDPTMCTGAAQPWKKIVSSDNGLYAAGDADATIAGIACGEVDCVRLKVTEQTITLKGPGGKVVMPEATPTVTVQHLVRPPSTWATAQHS